ncbi:hypothetical protein [Streptomyces laurentii]|uniref:hypothetical protein n=1 Tax=Streptomyces laurentii TaxID=39478 RepID=UPI003685CA29
MLRLPTAPTPALRCVLTALGSPAAVHPPRTPALRAVQGPLSAELPLPVHLLGGPGGTKTAGTPSLTRLAAWRFLIRCGDRSIAAADTRPTPEGWTISHFCEGPYLAATERALVQAEALAAPYQPRLLGVPGLYMLALWLHADAESDGTSTTPGPADLLVPLSPAPPGIAAHHIHRAADLLPVIGLRLPPPPVLDSAASA